MPDQYYFGVNGHQSGPLPIEEIRAQIARGELPANTPIWSAAADAIAPDRPATLIAWAAQAGRFIKRPVYAAAWLSLGLHLKSVVTFFRSSLLSDFGSSTWWMSVIISSGFLLAAAWCFEIDFSLLPVRVITILAATYGLLAILTFPVVFHLVAMHEHEWSFVAARVFTVLWFACLAQGLATFYDLRKLAALFRYAILADMLMIGVVIMAKYIFLRRPVDASIALEVGLVVAFAALWRGIPRLRRRNEWDEVWE